MHKPDLKRIWENLAGVALGEALNGLQDFGLILFRRSLLFVC